MPDLPTEVSGLIPAMSTLQPRSTEIKGIAGGTAEYAVRSGLETDARGSASSRRTQSSGRVKDGPELPPNVRHPCCNASTRSGHSPRVFRPFVPWMFHKEENAVFALKHLEYAELMDCDLAPFELRC